MMGKDCEAGWPNPVIPGFKFSGVIYTLPKGGDNLGFSVGNEVFGFNWGPGTFQDSSRPDCPVAGTFSEYCMVPLDRLTLKPPELSYDLAASIPMAACAAYQCLFDCGRLQVGQRVLILGGDTPVGAIAIGIAKQRNAW